MQVDWELAARIARAAAGHAETSAPPARPAGRAAPARDQIVAATGLEPQAPLPPAEWIDRGAWIDANLKTMRSTIGPALEDATGGSGAGSGALGALQSAGGAVVAAEIGGLLGLFARRV